MKTIYRDQSMVKKVYDLYLAGVIPKDVAFRFIHSAMEPIYVLDEDEENAIYTDIQGKPTHV